MHIPSLKEVVSAEEWQLRCDLAACYRLVALHGWTDLVFTHISARLPWDDHHFLINAARAQTGGIGGRFVWPAMLRKLERASPGYDV